MMTIDAILAAHGVGGKPGPYFGNGSDGAFNPAAPPAPYAVNTTVTQGYEQGAMTTAGFYSAAGSVYPTQFNANSGGPLISGFIFDNGNSQTTSSTIPSASWSGSSSGYTVGTQIGVMFNSSQQVVLDGFYFITGTTTNSQQFFLWDTTTQAVVASVPAARYSAQSSGAFPGTAVYFSSPVTLIAGRDYILSAYAAGSSVYMPTLNSTYSIPTASASYTYTPTSTYTFNTTQDGPALVKQFTSVNIPANLTVTVSNRCQGMVWLVEGDVTIDGTICMDYLAAVGIDPSSVSANVLAEKVQQLYYPLGNNKFIVIGPGGSGGAGGHGGVALDGTAGLKVVGGPGGLPTGGTWWGGGLGGGGGGGSIWTNNGTWLYQGGAGGDAAFTGTSAGGASITTSAVKAGNNGTAGGGGSGAAAQLGSYTTTVGAGGTGLGGGGGGSAANVQNGNGIATPNGGNSTQAPGGLILIIAKGNITIGQTGVLTAKGGNGGAGGNYNASASGNNSPGAYAGMGGGGGGAGGGIIALLYRGSISNSGTTNVSGGLGGVGGVPGGTISGSWGYAQPGINGLSGQMLVAKLA